MSRYIGDNVTTAVKMPCIQPAADDVLVVDPYDPTVGVWQKAGTNNIGDGAITNAKVNASAAIDGSKLAVGSGPLSKLSATGFLDNLTSITTRVIDSLTDGTYSRTLTAALSGGKIKLDAGDDGFAQPSQTSGRPIAASADGAATNYVTNPSFEVNASGWNSAQDVDGGTPTLTRSTAEGVFGSACAEYVTPSGTPYADVCDAVTASSGQQWVGSMWVRTTNSSSTPAQIGVWFYDSATNNTALGGSTLDFWATGTWQRVFVTGTAPSSTAVVRVGFNSQSDWTIAFRLDGIQLEQGSKPSGYCDGTLGSGYSWSGTAHASSSSRTAGFRITNRPSGGFVVRDDGAVEAADFRMWSSGALRSVGIVPVGAVVAWMKSLSGVPALPDGWIECNGGTVSDTNSPLYGRSVPDLNGYNSSVNKVFLRGATTSGTSVPANAPAHTHSLSSHTHTLTHTHTITSHRHYLGDTDTSTNLWLGHNVETNSTGTNTGDSVSTPQTGAASNSTTTGPSNNGTGAASGTGYDGSSNNWPAHMEVVWIMRTK